jgi:hypothetical protein
VTGVVLFLRARGLFIIAALVAVEVVMIAVFGSLTVRPLLSSRISFAIGIVAPIIVGMAIGVTCGSPVAAAEHRSVRRLPAYRGLHRVILIVLPALLAAGAFLVSGRADLVMIATRNLAGFAGLALITAALVRPSLSWITPLLWLSLPPIIFDTIDDDLTGVWTFFAQPEGNANSATFAIAALVIGVALTVATEPPVYRSWGVRVRRRPANALSASTASPPKHTNHSIWRPPTTAGVIVVLSGTSSTMTPGSYHSSW